MERESLFVMNHPRDDLMLDTDDDFELELDHEANLTDEILNDSHDVRNSSSSGVQQLHLPPESSNSEHDSRCLTASSHKDSHFLDTVRAILAKYRYNCHTFLNPNRPRIDLEKVQVPECWAGFLKYSVIKEIFLPCTSATYRFGDLSHCSYIRDKHNGRKSDKKTDELAPVEYVDNSPWWVKMVDDEKVIGEGYLVMSYTNGKRKQQDGKTVPFVLSDPVFKFWLVPDEVANKIKQKKEKKAASFSGFTETLGPCMCVILPGSGSPDESVQAMSDPDASVQAMLDPDELEQAIFDYLVQTEKFLAASGPEGEDADDLRKEIQGFLAHLRRNRQAGRWPDYVFEKDFIIPAIDTVYREALALRHMPGVVPEERVNAGDFDSFREIKSLLEKVEVYLFWFKDHDERIKDCEERTKDNKERIEALERCQERVEHLGKRHELQRKDTTLPLQTTVAQGQLPPAAAVNAGGREGGREGGRWSGDDFKTKLKELCLDRWKVCCEYEETELGGQYLSTVTVTVPPRSGPSDSVCLSSKEAPSAAVSPTTLLQFSGARTFVRKKDAQQAAAMSAWDYFRCDGREHSYPGVLDGKAGVMADSLRSWTGENFISKLNECCMQRCRVSLTPDAIDYRVSSAGGRFRAAVALALPNSTLAFYRAEGAFAKKMHAKQAAAKLAWECLNHATQDSVDTPPPSPAAVCAGSSSDVGVEVVDYKSKLNCTLKVGAVRYETQLHDGMYLSTAMVESSGRRFLGQPCPSKKAAEQSAAQLAWFAVVDYKSKLNELTKVGAVRYETQLRNDGMYLSTAMVESSGRRFSGQPCPSKKAAEQSAAQLAWDSLRN